MSPETHIILKVHNIIYEHCVAVQHILQLYHLAVAVGYRKEGNSRQNSPVKEMPLYGHMIVISSSYRFVFSFVGCCSIVSE
jgi:hypothetical protein